jgi:hypothetical protein
MQLWTGHHSRGALLIRRWARATSHARWGREYADSHCAKVLEDRCGFAVDGREGASAAHGDQNSIGSTSDVRHERCSQEIRRIDEQKVVVLLPHLDRFLE